MGDKNLLNEIDKTMMCILKRITDGSIIVDEINQEKKLLINIKNGEYEIIKCNIDTNSNCNGIFIIGDERNTLEELKREVENENSTLDNGGLLIIRHIISNKEHMDSVKEKILDFINAKGIEDIKVYFTCSKNNEKLGLVTIGRKHLDLLADRPEYEEYSSNIVADKKCGGCCSIKEGSSNSGCGSKGCCKN
ncbi:hypothetical protein [Clostridium vincentii]|uniref:Uncharacterized protein n=1 Tax=Clostridium vincentii TaxID=52704 RepID=A0A2T0BEK5_9CLOT|nr:hypothetical protein [Clostridium vincentii]PRR82315.1 hypothetical protein CLVI_18210 [Clostridium vincentii]